MRKIFVLFLLLLLSASCSPAASRARQDKSDKALLDNMCAKAKSKFQQEHPGSKVSADEIGCKLTISNNNMGIVDNYQIELFLVSN